MRRERFNWIFTGLIVGIALAFTGLTLTGCGDDKAAGAVAGEAREQLAFQAVDLVVHVFDVERLVRGGRGLSEHGVFLGA